MDGFKTEIYRGKWKITGYTGTFNKFRDGNLELHPKSMAWRCVLRQKCFPERIVKEYQLTKKIKQVIVGRHVIIELVDGDNIHLALDQPQQARELGHRLKEIKENKMPFPVSPAVGDMTPNRKTESDERDPSEVSQTFLKRAEIKSRETLEKLSPRSAEGFYQQVCTFKNSCRTSLPSDDTSKNQTHQSLCMSPTFSWIQRTPVKHVRLQGFSNLGNTCYMNAILQSLFGLDMFTTDLIHWSEGISKHISEEKKKNYLFHVLLNLFLAKKCNGSTEEKCQLLAEVKKNISLSLKWFSGFEQNDAHEFLGQILDQLKEEAEKLNKEVATKDEKLQMMSRKGRDNIDSNPAVSNFEFKITHTITCSECGVSVNNLETFNDLSVDIPPSRALESTWSIQDALDLTFLPEQVEYTCENCGGKEAMVQHKFSKLPRVLVIHLKRYSYNAQTSRNMKLIQNLIIPKFLTLKSQSTAQTEQPLLAPEPAEALLNPRKFSNSQRPNRMSNTPKRQLNLDTDSKELHRDMSLRKAHESMDISSEDLTEDTESLIPKSMTEDEMMNLALERSMHDMDTPHKQTSASQNHNMNTPHKQTSASQNHNMNTPHKQTSASQNHNMNTPHKQTSASQNHDMNTPYTQTSTSQNSDTSYVSTSRPSSPAVGQVSGILGTMRGSLSSASTEPVEDLTLESSSVLCCQNGPLLEPPYKKAKLDDGQCDSAYNSFTEVGDKSHLVNDESVVGIKQELNSSGVDMSVSDEENKENYMPHTASMSVCEDGIETLNKKNGPKEEMHISAEEDYDEEEQLRLAIENSLKDMENMDIQHDLDDDLEKAKQLSLKEVMKQNEPYVITQQKPKDKRDLKRTKDEEEILKLHAQSGELPYSYQLVSIVSHIGHSSASGHYISDTYDMNRRMWYSWNDSHGQRIDWDELRQERERTGYLFFYAAKDVVEEMENYYYERRCRVRSLSLSALPRQKLTNKPSTAVKLSFNSPWMELR